MSLRACSVAFLKIGVSRKDGVLNTGVNRYWRGSHTARPEKEAKT